MTGAPSGTTAATGDVNLGIGQVGLGEITVDHRRGYRKYRLTAVEGFDPVSRARDRLLSDTPDAAA